jgi:flagellar protein FlaG
MANEIRRTPFLVQPPAKAGDGGGSATESQKKNENDRQVAADDTSASRLNTNTPEPKKLVQENTHLVIEKDDVNGGFIYKSIDRKTGEVIKQFPREDVLKAIARAKAAEGQILDTKA